MITKTDDKSQIKEYEVKKYTNQELEEKISKLKAETDEIISQKNEEILEKNKKILEKDKRIKRLEMFIIKNGLTIPKLD